MGKMQEEATFGLQGVDWFPFRVIRFSTTPSSTTPGDFAWLDASSAPLGGSAYCVQIEELEAYVRTRRWTIGFLIAGTYELTPGIGATSFSVGRTVVGGVDVSDGVNPEDERFLPHFRTRFVNYQLSTTDTAEDFTLLANLNIGNTPANAQGLPTIATPNYALDPANAINPLVLFDTQTISGDAYPRIPSIYYHPASNSWYLEIAGSIIIEVSTGTPALDYQMGWVSGPQPAGGSTQIINSVTVNNILTDFSFCALDPFPHMDGYTFRPTGYANTITQVELYGVVTGSNGYFEFDKADDTGEIWHRTNGSQLITPVPMRMEPV